MKPKDFQTPGYEDMELSTQVLIAEALRRGALVEILDREENFIRLRKGEHVEWVKDATRTSRDSYVTSLVMENKEVSKQLLREAGIRVPRGGAYRTMEAARKGFAELKCERTVVKPKSTNFGLGVSILEGDKDLDAALETAFSFGSTVLVEEFVEGREFRFLVVGEECIAVLHRVPANVRGDGVHSVEELVELKNADPRRGTGYRTPLEKIRLGEVESASLAAAGLDASSVLEAGRTFYLRKNSNISTGGDSLDFTDSVDEKFKHIAVQAARCAHAQICGVDIILNEDSYSVLELNFNPVLYFHDFPFEGENRHVEKPVLDLLGF